MILQNEICICLCIKLVVVTVLLNGCAEKEDNSLTERELAQENSLLSAANYTPISASTTISSDTSLPTISPFPSPSIVSSPSPSTSSSPIPSIAPPFPSPSTNPCIPQGYEAFFKEYTPEALGSGLGIESEIQPISMSFVDCKLNSRIEKSDNGQNPGGPSNGDNYPQHIIYEKKNCTKILICNSEYEEGRECWWLGKEDESVVNQATISDQECIGKTQNGLGLLVDTQTAGGGYTNGHAEKYQVKFSAGVPVNISITLEMSVDHSIDYELSITPGNGDAISSYFPGGAKFGTVLPPNTKAVMKVTLTDKEVRGDGIGAGGTIIAVKGELTTIFSQISAWKGSHAKNIDVSGMKYSDVKLQALATYSALENEAILNKQDVINTLSIQGILKDINLKFGYAQRHWTCSLGTVWPMAFAGTRTRYQNYTEFFTGGTKPSQLMTQFAAVELTKHEMININPYGVAREKRGYFRYKCDNEPTPPKPIKPGSLKDTWTLRNIYVNWYSGSDDVTSHRRFFDHIVLENP